MPCVFMYCLGGAYTLWKLLLEPVIVPRKHVAVRGSHVMVTGGSSGIGLAVACKCARQGARRITLVARNEEKLGIAKQEVLAASAGLESPPEVLCLPVDVSSSSEMAKVADGEAVDMLVCCAGLSHPALCEDLTDAQLRQMLDVNVLGCLNSVKAVLPGMKARLRGSIVLVSSQAGQVGLPGFTGYSASKFAVRGLAEALQSECKPFGVTVGVAYPPDTDTPGLHEENKTKPDICRIISEDGGLLTAPQVAEKIISGAEYGKFQIPCNFDGWVLSTLTAGFAPFDGLLTTLAQVSLAGILRAVALGYRWNWDRLTYHYFSAARKDALPKQRDTDQPHGGAAADRKGSGLVSSDATASRGPVTDMTMGG